MEKKDYYLGLDLGTNSIGWAVTDTAYNLLRAKGKDLWGARLFTAADPAVERRTKRVARRRIEREKARKAILKEFFAEAISQVDPAFYIKMEESFLHQEDRSRDNQQRFSLFNDRDFTDREFHIQFPTIFHLRKAILESEDPFDVRLVFLAIYNMFAHRGHFLNTNLDTTKNDVNLGNDYQDMKEALENVNLGFPQYPNIKEIEQLLSDSFLSRSVICGRLASLFGIDKKEKARYAVLKLMSGLSVKLGEVIEAEDLSDEDKKISFGFRESSYEEQINDIRAKVGDEWFDVIEKIRAMHDGGLLAKIMNNCNYLSQARVKIYENHHNDLVRLKGLLKVYNPDAYEKIFRSDIDGSYSAYVGSVNSHGKMRRVAKNRSKGALYNEIKKALKAIPEDNKDRLEIEDKIKEGRFLEKQLTSDNGVIPNQVHSRELRAILAKAEKHLSFLAIKDEKGLTVSDKIIQLFEFQIPYYVGPLGKQFNGKEGYNCWAVRKGENSGKVLPWNFEEKINLAESAELFIKRMVRKCSYLNNEVTLPKRSLLYEKFMVLNEINAIKVNGVRLQTKEKQSLFTDVFSQGKRVSRKQIKRYLISINAMNEKDEIEGIDINCNQSLTSVGKFRGIFGDQVSHESNKNLIEDIIFWSTIYSGDKKLIKNKIVEKYPDTLDKDSVRRILGFKCEGWGNLSKDFLEMTGASKETGECNSIIGFLWNSQVTLMELLSTNYTFREEIERRIDIAEKPLREWSIEDLDDMYLSPAVKRMTWQAMQLVSELESVLGHAPKRVFVEMTREEGEKVRTTSRKAKLSALYKSIGNESNIWTKELEGQDESYFKSRKLYLYYLQKGHCMYTGEEIPLSQLMNDNLYDTDHIYPRHYTKDDSIENNLVLVKKQDNATKSDRPLTAEVQHRMYGFWQKLKREGFINTEKFTRLTRRNLEFTREEKVGFINRQLVETSQAAKAITQILQSSLGKECKIVFSKARLVSDFRHTFDLAKARSVNDLHHANDAYLNIVVGNSYFVKFTDNPLNFVKKAEKNPGKREYQYHFGHFFKWDIKTSREVAWYGAESEQATIKTVKKILGKHSPLVTYKPEEGHGKYFEETIYSHKEAKTGTYIGIKTKGSPLADVKKYGGKTSISTLGYCLVEYKEKKKVIRSFEELPIFLGPSRSLTDQKVYEYIKASYLNEGRSEAANSLRVCLRFIPKKSLIKRDGYTYTLEGRTGSQLYVKNAVQLKLDAKWIQYIKKIEKANLKNDYSEVDRDKKRVITQEKNRDLYSVLLHKINSPIYSKRVTFFGDRLERVKGRFEQLDIMDQCKILVVVIKNISKSESMNLEKIGEGKSVGVCRIPMKISDCREFKLVTQSITGLFTYEKDLLKL